MSRQEAVPNLLLIERQRKRKQHPERPRDWQDRARPYGMDSSGATTAPTS